MLHVLQKAQLWHTALVQLLGIFFFPPCVSSARQQHVALFGQLPSQSLALLLSVLGVFADEWDTAHAVKEQQPGSGAAAPRAPGENTPQVS